MRLTLTKRAEYGVRLVMHLADEGSDQRMTAAHLAEVCQIPAGNVPTIMSLLSRSGILDCSPGRSGGCTLARPPDEISALEIIEALEGPSEIAHCLLDSRRCHGRDPECAVHHAWSEGRNAAITTLAQSSLDDAVCRERDIVATSPRRRTRRVKRYGSCEIAGRSCPGSTSFEPGRPPRDEGDSR